MEKPVRVCFVTSRFWPDIGGIQIEKQARYLREQGQGVLVVTLRHQKSWPVREQYATVPVVRVGGWYRRGGLWFGKLGHIFVDLRLFLTLWHLRRSYDLIHSLQVSPLAVVATLVGRLARKPVIIGVQSTGAGEHRVGFSLQESRDSARGWDEPEMSRARETGGDIADLQQTIWGGQRMLGYLRRSNAYYQILSSRSYIYLIQHGFRPERIVYIPIGIDSQQFYPSTRRQRTLQSNERIVLCVARLEYAKGLDVLLHAWARMIALPTAWREGLRPRLRLVGDGMYRAELEQLVEKLGLQESVEFLGMRYDIAWLLQGAWGFVLPSRWEGMPNALLEAMACGLPCIATRVSGSEDVIEQGVNGLLVEPERPEQLAYALRLLIEDTVLARRLGWRGYETLLCYYQLSSTTQSCLAFYRYLLSRNVAQQSDPARYEQDLHPYPEEWQRYD